MRNVIKLACMFVGLLGLLPKAMQAQVHVDLGFGHGHHGHGHHWHHGWHPHYHDYWYPTYAYRPYVERVYVTPAPQATYQQPSNTMALESRLETPVAKSAQATPRANSLPGSSARNIVVRNASESEASVYFLVGTTEYELAPGASKTLPASAPSTVEYDRGGDFGTIAEEVTTGTYEFAVTTTGWDLKRQPDTAQRTASRMVRKNTLPETSR